MKEIFDKIVKSTYQYLIDNNLKAMILGISGGIDSTVSAYICKEISKLSNGSIKFIGVSLPSNTNEDNENTIAKFIGLLCDDFIIHNIEPDYQNITTSFESSCGKMNHLQEGNIKARIRMMFLYNLASQYRGLVIDTDNLTEHYLGFWTIHGDVGDIAPIGDLWKTDIYNLAAYILGNKETDPVLIEYLTKSIGATPTDGNGVVAGGDMEQIAPGLSYYDVDRIIKRVVQGRSLFVNAKDDNAIIYSDYMKDLLDIYGESYIKMVIHRYFASHYKRKKLPIKINVLQSL